MAMGMFCGIPLPFHIWDEKLTAVMVAALPLVGLVIGAIWWVVGLAFAALGPPLVLAAAIMAVVPFFAAGFIHLDGYMDTSDALLSRRDRVNRLRILKDPHVGAFAVVMLVILFLLQFASMHAIMDGGRYLVMLVVVCALSRSCSALAILILRHMPESNYAALLSKKRHIGNIIFIGIIAMGAICLSVFYIGPVGLIVPGAVFLGYTMAMHTVYKSFGGISGDLLGYSMIIGELCGLIVLALIQGVLL